MKIKDAAGSITLRERRVCFTHHGGSNTTSWEAELYGETADGTYVSLSREGATAAEARDAIYTALYESGFTW